MANRFLTNLLGQSVRAFCFAGNDHGLLSVGTFTSIIFFFFPKCVGAFWGLEREGLYFFLFFILGTHYHHSSVGFFCYI